MNWIVYIIYYMQDAAYYKMLCMGQGVLGCYITQKRLRTIDVQHAGYTGSQTHRQPMQKKKGYNRFAKQETPNYVLQNH